MKKLFENWRSFLSEDEREEFGVSFKDDIKECERGMNLGGTLCLQEKGYKLLGEGSFRDTLAIPGSKQYVLKVASHRKGLRMNELEADYQMQRRFPDLVPKTYAHSDDYRWVVVERVYPWGGSEEDWVRAFFPAFADEEWIKNNTAYPNQRPDEFFREVSQDFVENVKQGDKGESAAVNSQFKEPSYKRRLEFQKKLSPLYKRFIDLAAEYNVEFWDIVGRNIGVREDDSFVILDLSVFEEGRNF